MICIGVRDLSSTDITINDNFIGGSAPGCGGTAWTKTSATRNVFNAIWLYVGPTVSTTTSVQGNTISNNNFYDFFRGSAERSLGVYLYILKELRFAKNHAWIN